MEILLMIIDQVCVLSVMTALSGPIRNQTWPVNQSGWVLLFVCLFVCFLFEWCFLFLLKQPCWWCHSSRRGFLSWWCHHVLGVLRSFRGVTIKPKFINKWISFFSFLKCLIVDFCCTCWRRLLYEILLFTHKQDFCIFIHVWTETGCLAQRYLNTLKWLCWSWVGHQFHVWTKFNQINHDEF